MDVMERYPMHIEDESDSDAETFIVPTASAVRTWSNTAQISSTQEAELSHNQAETGKFVRFFPFFFF